MAAAKSDEMYHLTFSAEAHNPPLTADEVNAKGLSACDAIVIAAIDYDGPDLGVHIIAFDGRTSLQVPPEDLFLAWKSLGAVLAGSELPAPLREAARLSLDAMEDACQAVRESNAALTH